MVVSDNDIIIIIILIIVIIITIIMYYVFMFTCNISGTGKKIDALAKKKDCAVLHKWNKSIVNHMFWWEASSKDDDVDLHKRSKMVIHEQPHYGWAFWTWKATVPQVSSRQIALQGKGNEMAQTRYIYS